MKRKTSRSSKPRRNPANPTAQAMADKIRAALGPIYAGYFLSVQPQAFLGSSHVAVRAYGVPSTADELARDNAKTGLMVIIDSSRSGAWPEGAPAPDEVSVKTLKGGSQQRSKLRARSGPPDKVTQYVIKWFTDNADEIKGIAPKPKPAMPSLKAARPSEGGPTTAAERAAMIRRVILASVPGIRSVKIGGGSGDSWDKSIDIWGDLGSHGGLVPSQVEILQPLFGDIIPAYRWRIQSDGETSGFLLWAKEAEALVTRWLADPVLASIARGEATQAAKPKTEHRVPAWERRWGGFTQDDEDAANRYTHFPRQLDQMNQGLRESMLNVEGPIRANLKAWGVIADADGPLPADIDTALHRYHAALMHRRREDSRAVMIAPPWTVTGRSGYKGKPDKANKVMDNAQEVVDKALAHLSKVVRGYDPNRAIMAGDVDAIDRLREKLDPIEAQHRLMVESNKILRSKKDPDTKLAELMQLGVSEERARRLFEPDLHGRVGYDEGAIRSLYAEIRRLKERLATLEAVKGRESVEFPFEGGTVTEDTDKMRLQIRHDTKPSRDVIDKLSKAGFHWARSEMAWQRTLTEAARSAAREIVGNYDAGAEDRPLYVKPTESTKAQQLDEERRAAGRKAVVDFMTETPGFSLETMTASQAADMLRLMFRSQGYQERKKDDSFSKGDRRYTLIPAENKLRITVQAKMYGTITGEKSAERDLVDEARKLGRKALELFSAPVPAEPEGPMTTVQPKPVGMMTEAQYRKAVENAYWQRKNKDNKSVRDGVRFVMWLEPGRGTTSSPISEIPLEVLEDSLPGKSLPGKPDSITQAQLAQLRSLVDGAGYDPAVGVEELFAKIGLSEAARRLRDDPVMLAVNFNLKRRPKSPPPPRARIDDPAALDLLGVLEGPAWVKQQMADKAALSDPRGFYANLAAFQALKQTQAEMGDAASDLYVWDILPDAGFITGEDGRVYTVMPDGNIALNADSATPDKRAQAARLMIVG